MDVVEFLKFFLIESKDTKPYNGSNVPIFWRELKRNSELGNPTFIFNIPKKFENLFISFVELTEDLEGIKILKKNCIRETVIFVFDVSNTIFWKKYSKRTKNGGI